MWREASVALVKVIFQYLQEETDDYHEEIGSWQHC
jgi:hypothetical protein